MCNDTKIADSMRIEFSQQRGGVYQWRVSALAGEEELNFCVYSSRQSALLAPDAEVTDAMCDSNIAVFEQMGVQVTADQVRAAYAAFLGR